MVFIGNGMAKTLINDGQKYEKKYQHPTIGWLFHLPKIFVSNDLF